MAHLLPQPILKTTILSVNDFSLLNFAENGRIKWNTRSLIKQLLIIFPHTDVVHIIRPYEIVAHVFKLDVAIQVLR